MIDWTTILTVISFILAFLLGWTVVAYVKSEKRFKARYERKGPIDEVHVLLVPIEVWSEFSEVLVVYDAYRPGGGLTVNNEHLFEYMVQPDLAKDAMWVQYRVRDPKIEEYIEGARCETNRNHPECEIFKFDGTIPEEYLT